MSFLRRWGFTRSERVVICVLTLALVLGVGFSHYRQRVQSQNLDSLTPEDSVIIEKLQRYTKAASETEDKSHPYIASDTLVETDDIVPININTATAEELQVLPGIGPVLAERIVEYRNQHGPFTCADSLIKVNGIGKGKMQKLKDKIIIDNLILEE